MHTFTDKFLKSLLPRDKAYFVREEGSPGFAVRISKSIKTFYYVKTVGPKKYQIPLGKYPALSLKEARIKYLEASLHKPSETLTATHSITLKVAIQKYSRGYLRTQVRPRTAESYECLLSQLIDLLPNNISLQELDRSILRKVFRQIGKKHPVKANRMKAAGSSMCSYYVEEDLLDFNPWIGIKSYTETPKDRWLTEKELKVLLPALSKCRCHTDTRLALINVLLTASRSNETLGLKVPELDLEEGSWLLPSERSKTHREHLKPLSSPLKEVFTSKVGDDMGFVFKALISPEKRALRPVSRHALLQVLERLCEQVNIPHTTVHDLRRTSATHLGRLKVAPHVVSRILNHAPVGTTAKVYNVYSYYEEAKDALEELAEYYQGLGLKV